MTALKVFLGLLVTAAIIIVGYAAGYVAMKYMGLDINVMSNPPILGITYRVVFGVFILAPLTFFGVVLYEIGSTLVRWRNW